MHHFKTRDPAQARRKAFVLESHDQSLHPRFAEYRGSKRDFHFYFSTN